jgi:hypothetical protein
MGSFEENYNEATLSSFTEEERIQLRELHRQLDAKFDEIASFIGAKLGYEPKAPLQRLLHEHHSIGKQITGYSRRGGGLISRERVTRAPPGSQPGGSSFLPSGLQAIMLAT